MNCVYFINQTDYGAIFSNLEKTWKKIDQKLKNESSETKKVIHTHNFYNNFMKTS